MIGCISCELTIQVVGRDTEAVMDTRLLPAKSKSFFSDGTGGMRSLSLNLMVPVSDIDHGGSLVDPLSDSSSANPM